MIPQASQDLIIIRKEGKEKKNTENNQTRVCTVQFQQLLPSFHFLPKNISAPIHQRTTKTRTNYQFIFKNFFAPWVRGKPAVYTPDFVKLNYKNEI